MSLSSLLTRGFKRPRVGYHLPSPLSSRIHKQCLHPRQQRWHTTLRDWNSFIDNSQVNSTLRHFNAGPAGQAKKFRNANLYRSKAHIKSQLASRLSFFFSDVNLRHDAFARSSLIDNTYLPLSLIMSFKSIQRWTDDASLVLEVAHSLGLQRLEYDNEWYIGRSVPFHYETSLFEAKNRIMIVTGWPVEINTRWVEDRLRSLLESSSSVDDVTDIKEPIVYWGKNVPGGIITIEFQSELYARKAWSILQSMTQVEELKGEKPHPAELICEFIEERQCRLMVSDLILMVNGLEMEEKVDAKAQIPEEVVEVPMQTAEFKPTALIPNQQPVKALDTPPPSPTVTTTSPPPKKWWDNPTAAPSLSRCLQSINRLHSHHQTLPPPPREWLHESRFNKRLSRRQNVTLTDHEMESRRVLCRDVASILSRVHNSIHRGVIRALGARDAHAMSDFLERAMGILSMSPPPNSRSHSLNENEEKIYVSPFEACMDALNILQSLNLDVHPKHYSYAIRCACHEFRWEEASHLFLGQIEGRESGEVDGAMGGMVPLDSTLGWDQPLEVGLYAVSIDAWRKCQLKLSTEGEDAEVVSPSVKVFDTAMKMSMISPTGQESYVLAAGSALGRAGLWSDCLDFATDPSNVNKYGPSIAAAAMLACIESHRSTEAIELYNFFFHSENQSTASEWQWAGGSLSAAKPLFDNLLLRAMGGPSSGGYSQAAIQKFCEMVDNDTPFSSDALVGLMHSIENDGDWQTAVKLLEAFCELYHTNKENSWRLVDEMLTLSGIDDANSLTDSQLRDLTAQLLASAMRACNKDGFFSLSLLICSIVHSFVDEDFGHKVWVPDDESAIKAITSQTLLGSKVVRDAYIHSLSKVGLQRLVNATSNYGDNVNPQPTNKQFRSGGEAMLNAFITASQVLVALDDIRQSKKTLSTEDQILITRGLASAMNFYLDANHPASAMHLFNYASTILITKRQGTASNRVSFAETMSTFFDDSRLEPTAAAIFQTAESIDRKSLRLNDSLLSAVMRTYTMMGQPEQALTILKDIQGDAKTASLDTIQSFNSALEVLLESNVAEFMSFFEDSNSGLVMPSTFLALARKYVKQGAWPELGELYNEARRRGCVSEELGFIAMQAVCEAQLDNGKIIVLRKIADDISNTVGMKTKDWLSSQYWHIKRFTGFHYARMLMKWNTPSTSQREELLFAINEMRQCRQQGVLTKNAPLFCIVKQGELYESDDGYKGNRLTENQRRAAINIIFEACAEAQLSGLIKRPAFTAEVVRSLVALNGDKQCIQFVKTLIADGEKCKHKVALEYAIKAASSSRDSESLKVLIDAFEMSGFNVNTLAADNS